MTKHGSHGTCERCGHTVQVANTFAMAGLKVQYLACRACGHRPTFNKVVSNLNKRSNNVLVSTST